jgi:hypothetical protein
MSKLLTHVHVYDDRSESHVFGPDDVLPEWAAREMGSHVFEGGTHPFPDEDGDGESDRGVGVEPPRSGKGSGRDTWVAFASEKEFGTESTMTRDQIIAAMFEAKVISE